MNNLNFELQLSLQDVSLCLVKHRLRNDYCDSSIVVSKCVWSNLNFELRTTVAASKCVSVSGPNYPAMAKDCVWHTGID
jgi:hypothetical protein